jgi:hypothetical protein
MARSKPRPRPLPEQREEILATLKKVREAVAAFRTGTEPADHLPDPRSLARGPLVATAHRERQRELLACGVRKVGSRCQFEGFRVSDRIYAPHTASHEGKANASAIVSAGREHSTEAFARTRCTPPDAPRTRSPRGVRPAASRAPEVSARAGGIRRAPARRRSRRQRARRPRTNRRRSPKMPTPSRPPFVARSVSPTLLANIRTSWHHDCG